MIHKEIEFYHGIRLLNKYDSFMDFYWKPHYMKNGLPVIQPKTDMEKDIMLLQKRLNNPREHDKDTVEHFTTMVDNLVDTIKFKFISTIPKENQKYALFRYHTIGALNNISLSVSPELKKKWGITFELFGAFYNTNHPYCGLFNDLEPNCLTDVLHFKLQPNMTLLVNPPYTEEWINTSCELIGKFLRSHKKTTIYFVVPVWNTVDRKKLNLSQCDDLPILDALKLSKYLISHTIEQLPFYDGIRKKQIHLKDKVHVYHLTN